MRAARRGQILEQGKLELPLASRGGGGGGRSDGKLGLGCDLLIP